MSGAETWPWLALLLLGAWHGVNPGMGWLFAVARGLQERRGRAVWRALPPLAAGHALAVGAAIAVGALLGLAIPVSAMKWIVAVVLLAFGVYRLFRHGHPGYGGMRVGPGQLAVWSFLMATAHGAGLMVLPFVLGASVRAGGHGPHASHAGHLAGAGSGGTAPSGGADALLAGLSPEQVAGIMAAVVHTAGYLLVTGLVAWLVYRKLGLRRLRQLWWNLDLVWAVALIATALVTPWL
ncbi:MAG: hypothetical protein R6X22_06580 [Gemmatimonadota bacterium]